MKHLLLFIATACLATSGCAQRALFGHRDCGEQVRHVARSQVAQRPAIYRTTHHDSGGGLQGIHSLGKKLFSKLKNRDNRDNRDKVARAYRRINPNPHAQDHPEMGPCAPGPPVGQVAYPYYTVRGPRDFLRDNPPSIGPY